MGLSLFLEMFPVVFPSSVSPVPTTALTPCLTHNRYWIHTWWKNEWGTFHGRGDTPFPTVHLDEHLLIFLESIPASSPLWSPLCNIVQSLHGWLFRLCFHCSLDSCLLVIVAVLYNCCFADLSFPLVWIPLRTESMSFLCCHLYCLKKYLVHSRFSTYVWWTNHVSQSAINSSKDPKKRVCQGSWSCFQYHKELARGLPGSLLGIFLGQWLCSFMSSYL